MKAIGKVLTKKQRKAIKEETMEISQSELNKLFNGKRDKPKNKFKEIKIGSATLCNPEAQERCKYGQFLNPKSYCIIFQEETENKLDKMFRLPKCLKGFGKQMILTGKTCNK